MKEVHAPHGAPAEQHERAGNGEQRRVGAAMEAQRPMRQVVGEGEEREEHRDTQREAHRPADERQGEGDGRDAKEVRRDIAKNGVRRRIHERRWSDFRAEPQLVLSTNFPQGLRTRDAPVGQPVSTA